MPDQPRHVRAYRGYRIVQNLLQTEWYIMYGTLYVATADSLEEAKQIINALVKAP